MTQVQALIKGNEALVYFVDTPKESFVWALTKQGVRWVKLPHGTEALSVMVRKLRCGFDGVSWQKEAFKNDCNELLGTKYSYLKYSGLNKPLPFDTNTAHALYSILFGQIKESIKGKKLLLVPSGPLTSLPFQVLLTKKPQSLVAHSHMDWLINEHALTVLPSVPSPKVLRQRAKSSKAKKAYLGVGNPLLTGASGEDQRAWKKQSCGFSPRKTVKVSGLSSPLSILNFFRGGAVDLDSLRRAEPLPETADELCAVADVLGAGTEDVKLGALANEAHVKSLSGDGILKQHRIIHFATHGLIAGETADFVQGTVEPSLLLTPPDSASSINDGLLTASEVSQLKLDADWVILSACNTA